MCVYVSDVLHLGKSLGNNYMQNTVYILYQSEIYILLAIWKNNFHWPTYLISYVCGVQYLGKSFGNIYMQNAISIHYQSEFEILLAVWYNISLAYASQGTSDKQKMTLPINTVGEIIFPTFEHIADNTSVSINIK